MGLPLEPLTAHDIGQAACKEDHRQDEEEQIKHGECLPTNRLLHLRDARELYWKKYSERQIKMLSKEGPGVSRFHQKWGELKKLWKIAGDLDWADAVGTHKDHNGVLAGKLPANTPGS
jgi:hypothetical protein